MVGCSVILRHGEGPGQSEPEAYGGEAGVKDRTSAYDAAVVGLYNAASTGDDLFDCITGA